MPRFPLGRGRFTDIPEDAKVCNRFPVSPGEKDVVIVFLHDDGTKVGYAATIAIPRERIGAFAKSVVVAAESLGVDWKSAETEMASDLDAEVH